MIIMMENPKGISPSQRVTVDNLANLEMSCSRKSDDDGDDDDDDNQGGNDDENSVRECKF